jgi:hypothetical protein
VKSIGVLTIFLGLLSNTIAQQTYFNERLNVQYLEDCNSLIVSDSVYYGWGGFYNGTTTGILMVKIDQNGNFINKIEFASSTSSQTCGQPGSVINFNDSLFIVPGARRVGNSYDATLQIFNYFGDTIYSHNHGDSLFQASYDVVRTRDNGFVLLSKSNTYSYYGQIELIKFDSTGSIEWSNHYPNIRDDFAYSIDTTFDGGFILTGTTTSYGILPPSTCAQVYVLKVGSSGNLQWTRNFGGPYFDTGRCVIQSSDSNYLIAGSFEVFHGGLAEYCHLTSGRQIPYFIKLNQSGDTLWTRTFKGAYGQAQIESLIELPDESYIGCGFYRDSTLQFVGIIMHLSSEGDSLWIKTYSKLTGTFRSSNILHDIKSTPDGGYIAIGRVNPLFPDTGYQDLWVIKIDSLGCEVSNCLLSELEEKSSLSLHIWPNPFLDQINIEALGNKVYSYTVYDNQGRLIKECKECYKEIFLPDLEPGIYTIRIQVGHAFYVNKIIKT